MLTGKNALVTGASRGIGRQIALHHDRQALVPNEPTLQDCQLHLGWLSHIQILMGIA